MEPAAAQNVTALVAFTILCRRNAGRPESDYGLREVAAKAAAQYRPGQDVTVYYDPEQPGNALLEPATRKGTMMPLISAAICAVVGGIFLTFLIKAGFN